MTEQRLRMRPDPTELEDVYRVAFQTSDAASAILNLSHGARLVDATNRFLDTWTLERTTTIGLRVEEIFSKASAAQLIALGMKAIARRTAISATFKDLASAKKRFPEANVRACRLPGNLVSLTLTTPTPAEAPRNALMNDIGLVSGGLIYIYDLAKKQTRHINEHLAQMLGYARGSSIHFEEVLPLVHPDDVAALTRHVEGFAALGDGEVSRATFRIRRRDDGDWRWIDNRAAVFARSAAGHVSRVMGYAWDVTIPRRTSDDLAEAATALLTVEEKERRRIARELHDSTAQHLVAADLMVAAFERKTGAQDPTLTEVRETLSVALREIRTFSFLLHPPRLREQGLGKTLEVFADGFAKRAGLKAEIAISSLSADLSPAVEMALFRVAQESLMNVRRHANAASVRVRLRMKGNQIVLEIEDDGVGVGDVETISRGVGIDGMRARLTSLGGRLSIENRGGGTLVKATVPMMGG